jgi:glycosyltransferase involved in cell wall biosynthesis
MSEHILLINFDFPPNQGIGGRRWGKLAKGLANEGYKVHVIKADPIPGNKTSIWTDDVKHPNITVTSIRRTYPLILSHPGSSIIDKLRYKLELFRLKRQVKGTIYDLSATWDQFLIPACERICSEFPISRIIATGAPWHLLFSIGEWNAANRNLQYIVDFRDPWLYAKNYGMASLDAKRKAFETHKQGRVLELADVILSPANGIIQELIQFASEQSIQTGSMFTLHHFFDEDDFKNLNLSRHSSSKEFRIVYGGDLYLDLEPELRKVVAFFLESNHGEFKVHLDIYTDASVPAFMRDVPSISIHPTAGKSFYTIASQADAFLILLPEHKKNEFTTKFYDNLPFQKPYLVATHGGEVAQFVEQHEMGYVWKSQDVYPWYEHIKNNTFNFSPHNDIAAYSLTAATKQLITLFR